jgi:integrase
VLAAAVSDRRPASNPAVGVKIPRTLKKERHYLDHGALHGLAQACRDYELLILILGYCGLRWGEAAALRVGESTSCEVDYKLRRQ